MRPSGRQTQHLRNVSMTRGYTRHAEGSVLVAFGDTKVLCTASVEAQVPPFLRGKGRGWITAEYGMLPRATHTRSAREAAKGKQTGRTQEIQRDVEKTVRHPDEFLEQIVTLPGAQRHIGHDAEPVNAMLAIQELHHRIGIGNRCGFVAHHDQHFLCGPDQADHAVGNSGGGINQ